MAFSMMTCLHLKVSRMLLYSFSHSCRRTKSLNRHAWLITFLIRFFFNEHSDHRYLLYISIYIYIYISYIYISLLFYYYNNLCFLCIRSFYWPLFLIFGFILSLNVPLEYWDESIIETILITGFLRFAIMINISWLVNSAYLVWNIKEREKLIHN